MRIKDVLTAGVESATADLPVNVAAARMRDSNIEYLPVLDRGYVIGIITDRDICCHVVGENRDPSETRVRDIMSTDIPFCFNDQSLLDAAERMESHRIRRLVILNRDKTLAGFLSIDDLARWSHDLAGNVLEAVRPAH